MSTANPQYTDGLDVWRKWSYHLRASYGLLAYITTYSAVNQRVYVRKRTDSEEKAYIGH